MRRNTNSPLRQENCLRQSGLLYRWEQTGIRRRPDLMVLMQSGGAAIKSSWSHPRPFEPKSNQATDSARTDFLHRLVFLLPLRESIAFASVKSLDPNQACEER